MASLALDLSRLCNPPEDGKGEDNTRSPSPAAPLPDPDPDPGVDVDVDVDAPSLSFIVICEASRGVRICIYDSSCAWDRLTTMDFGQGTVTFVSDSVSDIIGFEREETIGLPASAFAHPEDAAQLYHVYQVGPHLVGGVSPATSGVKAMYNASTAQEVYIIAPTAAQFEIRRWNDAAPAPSAPPSAPPSTPVSPPDPGTPLSTSSDDPTSAPSTPMPSEDAYIPRSSTPPLPLHELSGLMLSEDPPQSPRTALILDRFSMNCTVMHITNDDILPVSLTMGRSFYDFVTAADEDKVRSAMDTVKGWGVNERGHPSDGGFAFYRFKVLLKGRNSRHVGDEARWITDHVLLKEILSYSIRPHDPAPARHRHAQQSNVPAKHPYRDGRPSTQGASTAETPISSSSRSRMQSRAPFERGGVHRKDEMVVDAIFSPQSDGIIVILRRSGQSSDSQLHLR
ncbi:hypothetical protein EW145_g851 [Phellinidium pouzarii]|uniref:PAS domain-containing protein n=1 Tax=Phellinidium pouzarii TaxID=167371 RepID=A0A4S4LH12_9AGAM|nr:hypothetical protein EW145_g851 [Phellinidium pouzarii]